MRTSVLAFACLAVPCRPLRRAALMPKTLFARVGGDADKISSAYEEKRHAVPAATSRRILILDPACPAFVHVGDTTSTSKGASGTTVMPVKFPVRSLEIARTPFLCLVHYVSSRAKSLSRSSRTSCENIRRE